VYRGTHLDVQAANAKVLALNHNVLRGKHSSVRRRLVAIRLHLHATSDLHQRLTARGVSDVHERVVERRVDVADAHHDLALLDLQAKADLSRGSGLGVAGLLVLALAHSAEGLLHRCRDKLYILRTWRGG